MSSCFTLFLKLLLGNIKQQRKKKFTVIASVSPPTPHTRRVVNIRSADDAQDNLKLNWNVETELRWHTASSPFQEAVCRPLNLQAVVLVYLRNNTHLLPKRCNNTITEVSVFCVLNRSTVSNIEIRVLQREMITSIFITIDLVISRMWKAHLHTNHKAVPAAKSLFSKS